MSHEITHDDEPLLTRLRDLSLVDLDSLLAGSTGEQYAELLDTYCDDVQSALGEARQRIAGLKTFIGGADPLAIIDATPEVRAQDGGREGADRFAARVAQRAHACRALARIDDLAGLLLPNLLEADRRRAGTK
jgi:hypothetical protein